VKKESEKIGVPHHLKNKGGSNDMDKLVGDLKNLKGGFDRGVVRFREGVCNKAQGFWQQGQVFLREFPKPVSPSEMEMTRQ